VGAFLGVTMTPELQAQLEAIIIDRDGCIAAQVKTMNDLLEQRAALMAQRKALWGKLLGYICDTDIQTICTKAIEESSCH
jgi:hypothetical protein